jgi:hypothetical protein
MSKIAILPLLIVLISAMAVISGCGREPTDLGEALMKTFLPSDGYWNGSTNQGQTMSLTVANDGTTVNSFLINIRAYESWGWVDLQGTWPVPMTIGLDHQFSSGDNDFDIRGTFTGNNQASGTCYGEGVVNINGTNYSFSESVTWNAILARAYGKSPAAAVPAGKSGPWRVVSAQVGGRR